jgi:hypothetical protein
MDRQQVKVFRNKLNAHFASFATDNNCVVEVGNARFNSDTVTFKIEITPIVNGQAKTVDHTNFDTYCYIYGLKKEDRGREFAFHGKRYKICGVSPKAHRYPILAECLENGKRYKFNAQDVKNWLTLNP